jgi:hypothetical protein
MPINRESDSQARRPTTRDWIGAAVRSPGDRPSRRTSGTKFHIYRAPHFRLTFAVTDGREPPARVGLGRSIDWELVKTVDESGQRRVGFSEIEAKKAIAEKGYLLVKLPTA